jgi:hypothetical protein
MNAAIGRITTFSETDMRSQLTKAVFLDIYFRMTSEKLLLALPQTLARKLVADAAKKRKKPKTRQAIILETLAKKYRVKVESPKPGRPSSKRS